MAKKHDDEKATKVEDLDADNVKHDADVKAEQDAKADAGGVDPSAMGATTQPAGLDIGGGEPEDPALYNEFGERRAENDDKPKSDRGKLENIRSNVAELLGRVSELHAKLHTPEAQAEFGKFVDAALSIRDAVHRALGYEQPPQPEPYKGDPQAPKP